jgi:hypothetical protein
MLSGGKLLAPLPRWSNPMHRQRRCISSNGSCHSSQLPTHPPCATNGGPEPNSTAFNK